MAPIILFAIIGCVVQTNLPHDNASPSFQPGFDYGSTVLHEGTKSTPDSAWLGICWMLPKVRTDSREYESGLSSGPLNLQVDCGMDDEAPAYALGVRLGSWRVSYFALSLSGREQLEQNLIFEDAVFSPGSQLKTQFDVRFLNAFYVLEWDVAPGLRLLPRLGIHAPFINLLFENGTQTAEEGSSAVWPMPAIGLEVEYSPADWIVVRAGVEGTRVKYTNWFHEDGGEPSEISYNYVDLALDCSMRLSRRWSLTLGWLHHDHYYRWSSVEDRHRTWYYAGGVHAGIEYAF